MAKQINFGTVKCTSDIREQIAALGPVENIREAVDYEMESGLMVLSKWYLL